MKANLSRVLRSGIAMLLAICLVVGFVPTAAFAAPTELKYVSLGDSMTNGYGLPGYDGNTGVEDYGDGSYANLFAKWLETEGYADSVAHAQLAMSAMRVEDLHWLLELDYTDSDAIALTDGDWDEAAWNAKFTTGDYWTWNELCDDYRFAAAASTIVNGNPHAKITNKEAAIVAKYYQTAVKEADIITLGIGNGNFGVFAFGRIMEAIGFDGTPNDAMIYNVDRALAELDPALKAQIMALKAELTKKAEEYLVKYAEDLPFDVESAEAALETPTMKALINTVVYTGLSYVLNYAGTVEAILELNPDAEIILVALMNTFGSAARQAGADASIGDLLDFVYTPLNAYIAALPTVMQAVQNGQYADATFYYAEAASVECLVDVYESELKNSESVIRARFVEDIVGTFNEDGTVDEPGMVWGLVAEEMDLEFVTLAQIQAYDALSLEEKAAFAAQPPVVIDGVEVVNYAKIAASVAAYLAFEDAVKGASNAPVSLESVMGLGNLNAKMFEDVFTDFAARKTINAESLDAAATVVAGIAAGFGYPAVTKDAIIALYDENGNVVEDNVKALAYQLVAATAGVLTADDVKALFEGGNAVIEAYANTFVKANVQAEYGALIATYGTAFGIPTVDAFMEQGAAGTLPTVPAGMLPNVVVDMNLQEEYDNGMAEARGLLGDAVDGVDTAIDTINDMVVANVGNLCMLLNTPANLSAALNSQPAVKGLLGLFARCVIGNGLGAHPSANGHVALAEAIEEAYANDYTAKEETLKNLQFALDELLKVIETYGPDALEEAYKYAEENGYIDMLEQAIKDTNAWLKEHHDSVIIPTLEAQLEALEAQLEELKAQLKALNEELLQKKAELENAAEELAAKIEAAIAELEALIAEVEAKIAEIEVAIEELKAELAQLQKNIAALAEAVKDLEKAVIELKDALKAGSLDIAKKAAAAAREAAVAAYEAIVTLNEQIVNGLKKVEGLYEKVVELVNTLNNYVTEKLNAIAALVGNVADESIQAAIDAIKAELEKAIAAVENGLLEQIAALTAQFEEKIAAAQAALAEKLAQIDAEIAAKVAELNEKAAAQIAAIKAEIEAKIAEIEACIAEKQAKLAELYAALENASEEAKAKIEKMIAEVEAAIAELNAQLEAAKAALEAKIAELEACIAEKQAKLAELYAALENATEEVKAQIEKQIAEVEAAIAELKAQLEAAKAELEAKIAEIKACIAEKKAQLEKLYEDLKNTSAEVKAQIEKQIATVEAAIAELKAELLAAKAELEAKIAEVKAQVEKQIATAKAQIEAAYAEAVAALEKAVEDLKAELEAKIAELKAKAEEQIEALKAQAKKQIETLLGAAEAAVLNLIEEVKAQVEKQIATVINKTLEHVDAKLQELLASLDALIDEQIQNLLAQAKAALIRATTADLMVESEFKYVALGDGSAAADGYAEALNAMLEEKALENDVKKLTFVNAAKVGNTVAAEAANLTADVADADLITLGFSQTEMLGNALKALLAGETSFDWTALVGEEGLPYVEKAMEAVNAEIAALELDATNAAQLSAIFEAYAYSVVEYAVTLPQLIKAIRAVNTDAVVMVVGMYNPIEGVVIDAKHPLIGQLFYFELGQFSEYFDYLIHGSRAYGVAFALLTDEIDYVDAPEVAVKTPTMGLQEFLDMTTYGDVSALYPSAEGADYIAEQIAKALNLTFKPDGLWGDANGDGKVLANDAMLVLRYSVGAISADKLNLPVCDVDGNGQILASDAMMILRHSVGALPVFPVEQ